MTVSKQISFDSMSSSTTLTPVEVQPFKNRTFSGYVVAFMMQENLGKHCHNLTIIGDTYPVFMMMALDGKLLVYFKLILYRHYTMDDLF